jgi:prolyl 4-hydroxylase
MKLRWQYIVISIICGVVLHAWCLQKLRKLERKEAVAVATKNQDLRFQLGELGRSKQFKPVMTWQVVHTDPHIILIHNFLTTQECDQLIALADPLFKPSTVIGQNNAHEKSRDRTSFSAHLPEKHSLVSQIEDRCAQIAMVPTSHIERIQAVRYTPDQFYRVHHDGITATSAQHQKDLAVEGQRLDTFFVYLNDLEPHEQGGSTHFPELNVKVKPRRGTAVFWKNCLPGSQRLDTRMNHAGLPPQHSIKYGLNIWTRANKRPDR